MNYEEAMEWLKGNRSMCNSFGLGNDAVLMTAQADEAMVEQAYWIVRAHREFEIKEK